MYAIVPRAPHAGLEEIAGDLIRKDCLNGSSDVLKTLETHHGPAEDG